MERVRIGIIGVAWPGQRHIEGYAKHPKARVTALSDLNTGAAERVKREYGLPDAKVYADYRELLASGDVDAVSICTPNFLHVPMAIDALDAGKHVLLEKPLAHTLADGERLAARVAQSPDCVFMIALNNRYRPDSILLRQRIEAGELGDIYYAKTGWLRGAAEFFLRGWFVEKAKSGGGPLIDLGVHMLDLALWLMGSPRPVSVTGSVYQSFNDEIRETTGWAIDVEDLAAAFVKLENGATVALDVSWVSHIEEGDHVYAQLFGTKGGAKITRGSEVNPGRREELRIITATGKGSGRATMVEKPSFHAARVAPDYMLYESFRAETADFVDSILEERRPGATIQHGLELLRVLDGIYRSAQTGKQIDLT